MLDAAVQESTWDIKERHEALEASLADESLRFQRTHSLGGTGSALQSKSRLLGLRRTRSMSSPQEHAHTSASLVATPPAEAPMLLAGAPTSVSPSAPAAPTVKSPIGRVLELTLRSLRVPPIPEQRKSTARGTHSPGVG